MASQAGKVPTTSTAMVLSSSTFSRIRCKTGSQADQSDLREIRGKNIATLLSKSCMRDGSPRCLRKVSSGMW
eukprot:247336-Amphidinium_carterae.1